MPDVQCVARRSSFINHLMEEEFFFDDLGPPWPKHPCTDRASIPAQTDPSNDRMITHTPSWERQGWIPFFISTAVDRNRYVYEIRGESGDSPVTIFVRKKSNLYLMSIGDFTTDTVAFLRSIGNERQCLSMISRSGEPVEITVYSRMSTAYEKSKLVESSSVRKRTRSKHVRKDGDDCIGTVKWFNPNLRYGFISLDDEKEDLFFHISALKRSGLSGLEKGQRVRVVVGPTIKGKEARQITIL